MVEPIAILSMWRCSSARRWARAMCCSSSRVDFLAGPSRHRRHAVLGCEPNVGPVAFMHVYTHAPMHTHTHAHAHTIVHTHAPHPAQAAVQRITELEAMVRAAEQGHLSRSLRSPARSSAAVGSASMDSGLRWAGVLGPAGPRGLTSWGCGGVGVGHTGAAPACHALPCRAPRAPAAEIPRAGHKARHAHTSTSACRLAVSIITIDGKA